MLPWSRRTTGLTSGPSSRPFDDDRSTVVNSISVRSAIRRPYWAGPRSAEGVMIACLLLPAKPCAVRRRTARNIYRSAPTGAARRAASAGESTSHLRDVGGEPLGQCATIACFETPSIVPISLHERPACRAARTASVKEASTRSRRSANSAIAFRASVSAMTRSFSSTLAAHASRAAARLARVAFMVSTIPSRTSLEQTSRE